jgi:serine/threonine protein phosphatase 1
MGRLFSIADIHGEFDLLKKLWDDLVVNHNLDLTKDKVIFTGDYVDRGPDSYGVIEFIYQLTQAHPNNVIALAGNHEWMMIQYYARGTQDDKELWEMNGGLQTIASFQVAGFSSCPSHLLKWLAFAPLKHEERNYFISHAPAPAEWARNIMDKGQPEFSPEELIWTYHPDEKGVARDHSNGIIGVSGHIHQLRKGIMAPRFYDHHYYLDAGCGCSPKAPLCAVNLDTKEVIYAWPAPVVKP